MEVDDCRRFFRYNQWANGQSLDACHRLSEEARNAERPASHGSIAGTVGHIVFGEWLWLRRWQELPPVRWPYGTTTFEQLRPILTDVQQGQRHFLNSVGTSDLRREITYINDAGEHWTYTLAAMLQHVVNHSTYHRGQLASMLRQAGVTPPPTDYLVYFDCGGS